jgi:hypothetical protein
MRLLNLDLTSAAVVLLLSKATRSSNGSLVGPLLNIALRRVVIPLELMGTPGLITFRTATLHVLRARKQKQTIAKHNNNYIIQNQTKQTQATQKRLPAET